jgi:hypothetical protein
MVDSVGLYCKAFVILLVAAVVGCGSASQAVNLQEWQKGQTLWTAPSGHLVVLYEKETALSANPQAIVCESNTRRTLLVLPPETFPLVSKHELNVFETKDRDTPGWYRLEHTQGLNWWERNIYSAKSLGGWHLVSDQESLPIPSETESRNALLILDHGKFQKIAEESTTKELFDLPVDGLVYVGEPGLGVVESVDLLTACP